VSGWLADKLGAAQVTFWNFIVMAFAVIGVLYFLPANVMGDSFAGFPTMFIVRFLTTGIGNGSTFRMIPVILLTEQARSRWQGHGSPGSGAQGCQQGGGCRAWIFSSNHGLWRVL